MSTNREMTGPATTVYRLEIGGSVGVSWAEWFEADTIAPCGDNTVVEVRVTDQAELYGRLRRIHDLNLRLIAVALVKVTGEPGATSRGSTT